MTRVNDGRKLQTSELRSLRENGFSNLEIKLLVAGRERFRRGEFTDETPQSKRLRFGKWLVDNGRVKDIVDDGHTSEEPATCHKRAA